MSDGGTLKTREWKTQDWKTWDQIAGVEKAALENAGNLKCMGSEV